MPTRTLLDQFDVSLDFLTGVVADNPSLRGMLLGYVAEAKLREILEGHGRATAFRKDDDHDRKKKGDLVVTYQGFEFKIEVKSLQTNTVEILDDSDPTPPDGGRWVRKMLRQKGPGRPNPAYLPVWEHQRLSGRYRGQFQCDASDRRRVTFPDNSTLETTNLLFGEFHILAAGLFAFREKWDFGFVLNRNLPASTNPAYPEYQRRKLIASMVPVTWPLAAPFAADIYPLLDKLVAEERARAHGQAVAETPVVKDVGPVRVGALVEERQLKVVDKKRRKKP